MGLLIRSTGLGPEVDPLQLKTGDRNERLRWTCLRLVALGRQRAPTMSNLILRANSDRPADNLRLRITDNSNTHTHTQMWLPMTTNKQGIDDAASMRTTNNLAPDAVLRFCKPLMEALSSDSIARTSFFPGRF